jgi:hypothetical protein
VLSVADKDYSIVITVIAEPDRSPEFKPGQLGADLPGRIDHNDIDQPLWVSTPVLLLADRKHHH